MKGGEKWKKDLNKIAQKFCLENLKKKISKNNKNGKKN